MSENLFEKAIAKETGLPEKAIVDGGDDLFASLMYKETGDANVFAPAKATPRVGFSGLDVNASTISLTNTYTDPLESYTSYGVPRNAFVDWNDIRAENQTTVEKWARGLTKAGITALGAVAENTVGVAGGLLNLAFGENHSYYDNPVGRSIDEINQWAQEAMPNYYTKREQEMGVLESLGTANFWADKFANGAGYTLGSLATAWLGVGEGAMLAKAANVGRMSKIAKAADKAMDVTQDAAKFGSKQFQLYNAAKVVNSQTGKTIAKGIDQGLAKMAKQAGIKTAAKNLSVGLHMSLAEASVEAREVKNKFIEEQTAKWEEANPGKEMPADVEDAIIASASAAGNVTFGVNLPLLVTTNAISFGKMFMGIKPTAEAKLFDIKKVKDKWVEAIPEKGMAKAFAKANRIVGAPLRNSISEGAQEAGQFITAEAAGDYYSDKFADGTGDMVEAFTNGLSKSIGTKEGLESILIGALVGGGSGTLSTLFGADKKFNKAKTANTQKALEILNSEGFGKVLENMEQSQRNMALVKEMGEATTAGEFKKAELARRKLISSVANQYRKAGALDFAIEQMDDLKQLDEEEFKKRWGYDASKTLKEQTGMEQGEIIDDVKSKMERSVKRQEQVQDILRAQQPSTGLFARILNSFESEELRNSKVVESSIRNMYGNVLLNRLEDVDANDDLIKEAYKELLEMAPALSQVPEEDFEYMVKTGAVKINDKGEVEVSDTITNAPSKKLADKISEIFLAKNILNPEDANQFIAKSMELGSLVAARESAIQSYNGLRDKPEDIALLVEAEVERRKQDDKYKNKQQAQAAIQNSESVEELDKAFPKNADPADIAAAMAKREELLKQEDNIIANYKKMSKEEFDSIDPESLSPLEESAYKRYKKKVDELEAEMNYQKNIGVSFPDENAPAQATASYEEVLTDIEARTFGEVMVNPDGNTVTIDGRTYSNLEDDPLDAILRDEQGTIIGVRMTDMATGNEVTWKSIDIADSSNPELTERENAIAEGLAYMTLLKAASIRSDQSVPLSEAREELSPRVQAIKEDVEVREKFEENTESTEGERELAKNNLSKTAGLTDDQLRAQIETLKSDLEELNEVLTIEEQIAREAGFTKKEFDGDPQTKELRAIKKRITQLIRTKIKALRDRKQTTREEALGTDNTAAEVENALSPSEEDLIKAGIEEEIKKFEDELVPLNAAAKGYEDIINGKYGEGQDITAATTSLKEVNKKIGVVKAKITKRKNLINKLNEERELEKLRQDRDSAERAGIAPEGQEPEGKDINPGEGVTQEGLDGILSEDQVKALKQQREEAERIRKQQEENRKAQQATPQPGSEPSGPVTISKAGELDVRLAKGEKEILNDKVLVSDAGIAIPSDRVQQTVNGTPIIVNPALASNALVAPEGTEVRFEVREDTDWWMGESTDIPADEHWKTVPIYMVVLDSEGVEQRVALLQSATEDSGKMRKDIYDLYKQGLTPVATSAGKIYNSTNYSNARLVDGTPFFYPASTLVNKGETPAIAIVGIKDSLESWVLRTKGDSTLENPAGAAFDASIGDEDKGTTLVLGQVGIMIADPNGNPRIVVASTRNMTESGRTAALSHITAETPSLAKFGQIVGTNLLINDLVDPSSGDAVTTELNEELKLQADKNFKNFMLIETLSNGKELITFFSPTAKSLVRISADDLKLALEGVTPMFSFIDVGVKEDGYSALMTTSKDLSLREAVSKVLGEEFKEAVIKKKFQVDKNMLNVKETYTSPITGEVYGSYFEYLTSEKEVVEEREEGKGSKSILAVDVEVNSQKSPFFDVGINTRNLGTREKDVIAERELAIRQVVSPSDNRPVQYPIAESPAAPVSDEKADIERRRQDEFIKQGFKLSPESSATEGPYRIEIDKSGEAIIFSEEDSPEGIVLKEWLAAQGITKVEEGLADWKRELAYIQFEVIDKINAKYDAELAALGQPSYTILSDSEKFDLGAYIVRLQILNDGNMEKTVNNWLEALSEQDPDLSKGSFNNMLDQVLTNPFVKKDANEVIEYTRELGNKWFDNFSPPAGDDVITDAVYNNFVDKNVVPDNVLSSIADKVINRAPLSQRETAIFSGKTSEINEIIRKKAAKPAASQNLAEVEKKIQEVVANKEFIKLSPDEKTYINTKTGKVYQRVTTYINEEEELKDTLNKGESLGDYAKRLESLGYTGRDLSQKLLLASSQVIGTKIDIIVRDFFSDTLKDLSEYDASSLEEIQALVKELEKIKKAMDARGEKVLANDIVLYNDKIGVAGTVDLLTYDAQGNIRIYDTKTMRGNNFTEFYKNDAFNKYESTQYGKSKKQKHTEQLSLYRILLNNTHGLLAKTIGVMPLEIRYNPGDTTTTRLNLLKGVALVALDRVEDAELGTGKVAPKAPVVSAEEKVVQITGAEDTSSIFDLSDDEAEFDDQPPSEDLGDLLSMYKVEKGFMPPGGVLGPEDMAQMNPEQANNIENNCPF